MYAWIYNSVAVSNARPFFQPNADSARAALRTWVLGFGKNSGRRPYILHEEWRSAIVPGAAATSVVPEDTAAQVVASYDPDTVLAVTGQTMQDLGLTNIDITDQGEDQVSEVGATITELDFGSPSPGSTFSGFSLPATSEMVTKVGASQGLRLPVPHSDRSSQVKGSNDRVPGPAPKQKSKTKTTRFISSPSGRDSSALASPVQGTGVRNSPAGASSQALTPVKPLEQQPQPDIPILHEDPLPVSQGASGTGSGPQFELNQVLASICAFQEQMKSELAQQREEMVQQRAHLEGQLSQFQGMVASWSQPQGGAAPLNVLPPVDSLPPYDPSNPWRPALFAPFAGGLLTIEGLGTRPISDFERFPQNAELPNCYVRLSEDAAIREDRVPRETVIYSRDRAQNCLVKELKSAGCTNTKLLPHNASLTIFQTPVSLELPFASKIITAVHQALRDDKTSPRLREEEFTSLLLPGDTEPWTDIQNTFTVGKLSLNAASEQFNEDLPPLTDALVKAEFEAKSRFARTLHTFTLLELTALQNPEVEFLKVIVKSMVSSLRFDAFAFGEARRKCRKYVLHHARIRHEPIRLINGTSFGENLFPNALVQEVIEAASRANQSLRTRWDMPSKRKHIEGQGPQPKNRPFKIPKVQSAPPQVIPVSASTSANSQQYVLVPSHSQSPVHRQPFERQTPFRAPGFSYQHHGRKSGRGKGKNFPQGRGRAQSDRRNKGRSQGHRRGRGRGSDQ